MKKRKLILKGKLKKWFNEKFLYRYLQGINESFIGFFTKKHDYVFEDNGKYLQDYKRIMKVLSSDKYKRFFYNVVNYNMANYKAVIPETPTIKPYGKSFSDRFKKFVAKTYIYFFRKELYDGINLFSKWKHKIKILNEKINNYMATTTVEERINRAIELKIITADDAKDFWDTTDYSKPVRPSYPTHPYNEEKASNPVPMERYSESKSEREGKIFKLPVPPEPNYSMSDNKTA
jgi:hypothetical protein